MSGLEIGDLSVLYGGAKRPAVRNVSMVVAQREIRVLVGESGSGKSTLGLAAQQLLPPTASLTGHVHVNGVPVRGSTEGGERRVRGRLIRYVPQEPTASLNPSRTVISQLTETLRVHGVRERKRRIALATSALESVGIPDPEMCLRLYPHELSGGMAQRVIIADALLVDPAVIIADEPTASLDATTAVLILSLLRRLASEKGAAVLLITHNIGHALAIGDSIDVMYSGSIVESGPVRPVIENPRMPYTAALLESRATVARGRDRLPVIPGAPGPNPRGDTACVFSARCKYADDQCATAPPPTRTPAMPDRRSTDAGERTYLCWHPIGEPADVKREMAG